jgi:hypothetical protein
MKLLRAEKQRLRSAFTMVEIAIALAVIGFALVAIIGVLPMGMQNQRVNREDTIINQDGPYFLEAIRTGARGLHDLTNYVTNICVIATNADPKAPPSMSSLCLEKFVESGYQIIGKLSIPGGTPALNQPAMVVSRVEAKVRSLSGAAVEKGQFNRDDPTLTFSYLLTSEITPILSGHPFAAPGLTNNLLPHLHEVRLTFRWPLLPNGDYGTGKKVFRTVVSGVLQEDGDPQSFVFFFRPNTFLAVTN